MIHANIRLGVIGAGAIGSIHMQTFNKVEGIDVVAVTDAYLPLAEQRAAEYGIETVHPSPQSLLEDSSIDAVVIGVPNQFHAELAIEALKQGKHVLLEKPMAIDSEAARLIVEEAEKSGKILMMSHQMRWTGLSRALKQRIDNGDVGHIYNAKAGWFRKRAFPAGAHGSLAKTKQAAARLLTSEFICSIFRFISWAIRSLFPYTARLMQNLVLTVLVQEHGVRQIGTGTMTLRTLPRRLLNLIMEQPCRLR